MVYLDGLISLLLLLIFVSALVSMVQELAARFFNLRARALFKLLSDDTVRARLAQPLAQAASVFAAGRGGKRAGAARVERQVVAPWVEAIQGAADYRSPLGKLDFRTARRLLQRQVPGLAPAARLTLTAKAAPALAVVEEAFDELLEEARAAFARRVQGWGFLIALVLAAAFNLDSVNWFQRLVSDAGVRAQVTTRLAEGGELDAVREKLVALAQRDNAGAEAWRRDAVEAAELLATATGGLAGLRLDIGLGRGFWDRWDRPAFRDPNRNRALWLWHLWVFWAWLGGILLTALLASFGSPYLYDALQLIGQARDLARLGGRGAGVTA